MTSFTHDERFCLRLMRTGPLVRFRGRWRFGTRRFANAVVDRLIAAGKVQIVDDRAELVRP